jgi:hypothetical protein
MYLLTSEQVAPDGHIWHSTAIVDLSSVAYCPDAHRLHAAKPGSSLNCIPTHSIQTVRSLLYDALPVGHILQLDEPSTSLNVPATHVEHVDLPVPSISF